jgi:hypothetical protein
MVDPGLCCSPIFALHVIEDSRQGAMDVALEDTPSPGRWCGAAMTCND